VTQRLSLSRCERVFCRTSVPVAGTLVKPVGPGGTGLYARDCLQRAESGRLVGLASQVQFQPVIGRDSFERQASVMSARVGFIPLGSLRFLERFDPRF
jgi:hypothetical protein